MSDEELRAEVAALPRWGDARVRAPENIERRRLLGEAARRGLVHNQSGWWTQTPAGERWLENTA